VCVCVCARARACGRTVWCRVVYVWRVVKPRVSLSVSIDCMGIRLNLTAAMQPLSPVQTWSLFAVACYSAIATV